MPATAMKVERGGAQRASSSDTGRSGAQCSAAKAPPRTTIKVVARVQMDEWPRIAAAAKP
jgi:hypothetical protein